MAKSKYLYVIKEVHHSIDIAFGATTITRPLDFMNGMIGALPVFSNKRKAMKNGGSKNGLFTIEVIGKEGGQG